MRTIFAPAQCPAACPQGLPAARAEVTHPRGPGPSQTVSVSGPGTTWLRRMCTTDGRRHSTHGVPSRSPLIRPANPRSVYGHGETRTRNIAVPAQTGWMCPVRRCIGVVTRCRPAAVHRLGAVAEPTRPSTRGLARLVFAAAHTLVSAHHGLWLPVVALLDVAAVSPAQSRRSSRPCWCARGASSTRTPPAPCPGAGPGVPVRVHRCSGTACGGGAGRWGGFRDWVRRVSG